MESAAGNEIRCSAAFLLSRNRAFFGSSTDTVFHASEICLKRMLITFLMWSEEIERGMLCGTGFSSGGSTPLVEFWSQMRQQSELVLASMSSGSGPVAPVTSTRSGELQHNRESSRCASPNTHPIRNLAGRREGRSPGIHPEYARGGVRGRESHDYRQCRPGC